MALTISTNLASINAQNSLSRSQRNIDKSFAQLASGKRITKAADDAAGLSISKNLDSQVKSFRQAQRNAADAMSMVQVAEGGLNEISNILTRFRELGVQAASDTVGENERGFINKEVNQLKNELQRIAETTRFGSSVLLDGSGDMFEFQIGINNNDFQDRVKFDASETNATLAELSLDGLDFSQQENAQEALTAIDTAQITVNGYRANLGAIQNRFISTNENLGVAIENLSAARSRIEDTDVAEATAELTRNNILLSASTGVLAQANNIPQNALRLLG